MTVSMREVFILQEMRLRLPLVWVVALFDIYVKIHRPVYTKKSIYYTIVHKL